MQIILGSILLLFIMALIVGLFRPNWIKLNTRIPVSIAFGITIVIFICSINYFDHQENKKSTKLQTQTVFEHKQSIAFDENQKIEKQTAEKVAKALEAIQTKEIDRSIKDQISSETKVEVSADSLIMDSNGNSKFRLIIANNSDYQINKMKLRISLKDSAGNTVENYDCEILQPVNAHGVLGDIIWMNVKGVVDQKTNIAIIEYSKPAK